MGGGTETVRPAAQKTTNHPLTGTLAHAGRSQVHDRHCWTAATATVVIVVIVGGGVSRISCPCCAAFKPRSFAASFTVTSTGTSAAAAAAGAAVHVVEGRMAEKLGGLCL